MADHHAGCEIAEKLGDVCTCGAEQRVATQGHHAMGMTREVFDAWLRNRVEILGRSRKPGWADHRDTHDLWRELNK